MEKVQIAAVLNLTPDSFCSRSRTTSAEEAALRMLRMAEEGVDIIDIGAVSTRPGAGYVNPGEEWSRLESVITNLSLGKPSLPGNIRISIDTTRSATVRKVHGLIGDIIVNDISAGEDDPLMLSTAAELGLTFIAMHRRGDPRTMDSLCDYPQGVVRAVTDYFRDFEARAAEAGLKDWILDPGFGFAKTDRQNIELLENLGVFLQFGRPVLAGIADKRFTHGRTKEFEALAIRNGASIIRIHL